MGGSNRNPQVGMKSQLIKNESWIGSGENNLHRALINHLSALHSVHNFSRAQQIRRADRVVFPGQGAIGVCRRELQRLGLIEEILLAVGERPFFGMCLGPQVLMDFSEENGGTPGLGVFEGQVRRFPLHLSQGGELLKIPHMGWNRVSQVGDHALWSGIADHAWFYFVHSYYLAPERSAEVAGVSEYGMRFPSAIARDNVFGVQFHPEKSAHDGLRLLSNFCAWEPS